MESVEDTPNGRLMDAVQTALANALRSRQYYRMPADELARGLSRVAVEAARPGVRAEAFAEAAREAYERGDIGKPDGGVEAWVWLGARAEREADR